MSFYADMAQVAVDLLTPDEAGGLGATAGTVTLVRRTVTPAANPWDDPAESEQPEVLLAQVFGVSAQLVGLPADEPSNGVIVASDRMVICAVPALDFEPGDLVAVNDLPVAVMRVERIPSAGTPVAFKLVVRG